MKLYEQMELNNLDEAIEDFDEVVEEEYQKYLGRISPIYETEGICPMAPPRGEIFSLRTKFDPKDSTIPWEISWLQKTKS